MKSRKNNDVVNFVCDGCNLASRDMEHPC